MDNNLDKELRDTENNIKLDKKKTALKKLAFIREIENGLGDEIKSNPNRVEFIEKPKENKIKKFFLGILKIF